MRCIRRGFVSRNHFADEIRFGFGGRGVDRGRLLLRQKMLNGRCGYACYCGEESSIFRRYSEETVRYQEGKLHRVNLTGAAARAAPAFYFF